jgi:uncharacterized membrane protein (UPF0136 family)
MSSPGRQLRLKKAFLVLLVVVCLAVVGWTAYLLFTNQTDPVTGGIILAVDIGVLVWNISVLRAYRVRAGKVVGVFIVVALIVMTVGAFAGIEPLATYAAKVRGWFSITSNNPSGTYVATVLGIEQSITFKGSTIEFYDVLDGERIFEFSISEDGHSITLRNVVTGKTHTDNYSYIKEYDIVVIGILEYHRR